MKHKLNYILKDLDKYEGYKVEDNINDRLKKTLELYINELDNSYSRLKGKDAYFVAKRLNKYEK